MSTLAEDVAEVRRVEARGAEFHVRVHNPGAASAVVCIAGQLGTAASDFAPQLSGGLGPDHCVVAFDPRGLGRSTAGGGRDEREYPLDPFFYREDALDAAALMEAMGHTADSGGYSVLGWSDGANAALFLAALDGSGELEGALRGSGAVSTQPSKERCVHRLVIWGGNARVTAADVQAWEAVQDVRGAWSERMREDRAALHGGVDRLQRLNDAATRSQRAILEQRAGDVCLRELHRVTCPTLVVHGSLDAICDASHARYIARHVTDARLTVFAEGKHNLHLRYADAFNKTVRAFLAEDGGAEARDAPGDTTTTTVTEPDIEAIAYGFMGSKALFCALRAGVFDAIAARRRTDGDHGVAVGDDACGVATFDDVEAACEVTGERLRTLLAACINLKLVRRHRHNDEDVYSLPDSSRLQLCRDGPHFWGDYLSGQVDAQFYSRMAHLDDTLRTGDGAAHTYESWFAADPDAARRYTLAQHNGSLATARALLKRMPDVFGGEKQTLRVLDVGGGSGAFSITICRQLPQATAVVLDLPEVTAVAEDIVAAEKDTSVRGRVSSAALSATNPGAWFSDGAGGPGSAPVQEGAFDVVLMSYVSGSIPVDALGPLYANAFKALAPGGVAIIHDFMVDNDVAAGPTNAALWALAHVSVNPDGACLRPRRIVDLLHAAGFVAPVVMDLIPGMTQTIVAERPPTM